MMQFKFPNTDKNFQGKQLQKLSRAFPVSRQGGQLFSDSLVTMPGINAIDPTGKVSPVSGVANTGNAFPFVVQGNFSFVVTGTSVTIYWDGTNGSQVFVIKRTDGSNATVTGGSIVISGLTSKQSYSAAPFVSVATQTVSFAVGDSGTPRYAFSQNASQDLLNAAAQIQNNAKNEKLTNGLVYFKTTASGGSTTTSGTTSNVNSTYNNQPTRMA